MQNLTSQLLLPAEIGSQISIFDVFFYSLSVFYKNHNFLSTQGTWAVFLNLGAKVGKIKKKMFKVCEVHNYQLL